MRSVFISSVVKGFEPYRATARKTIGNFGLHPVGCEDFGAKAMSPESACREDVESSDIYMLIAGERYGFESDGCSATEAEFETARALGKPIIVFVEKVVKEPKQDRFMKTVGEYVDGLWWAEFSNSIELQDQVTKSLVVLAMPKQSRSVESFESLVKASSKFEQFQNSNGGAVLKLSFLRDPLTEKSHSSYAAELQHVYINMGMNGLLDLKNGFDPLNHAEFDGLSSGRRRPTKLQHFSNGLSMLEASPIIEQEHMSEYFISPSRLKMISEAAALVLNPRGSYWINFELKSIGYGIIAEPRRQQSYTMRYQEAKPFSRSKLFSPFTQKDYARWVDGLIAETQRVLAK